LQILLVRLRLIGDVVFTTPLIRAVRRRYPTAHLAYLVEPAAAPVVRNNPHLDELIVAPKQRGLRRVRDDLMLAVRLRRRRFDIVIDLHGGPRSAWLTYATAAPMRVGYRIKGRTWMYTHAVDRAADLMPRHSVANQWDLLTPLGIEAASPQHDPVEMIEDAAAATRVEARLHQAGIAAGEPLVLIHVSAGNPFRRWPGESFVSLVVQLARRDPAPRIILFSGPSDPEAGRQVAAAARVELGDLAWRVPEIGEPDLEELRALVARAAVYIGGDTGPMHIAATTTTPIVELLGPTLAERSRPWRDPRWFVETLDAGPLPCRPCHQRECAPGDFRCLAGIAPQRVVAAAERGIAHWERSERSGRSEPSARSGPSNGSNNPNGPKQGMP
jgi:lipopolysaccharide heptosyltransferase II